MESTVDRLLSWLDASPTPFHAAAAAADRLAAAGYRRIDEGAAPEALRPGDRVLVQRAGTLVAAHVGSEPPVERGFRIVAAHTDSPNLRVKPNPLLKSHGYTRLGVEVYGGVLTATWTDRDLGLAGRVVLRDGDALSTRLVHLRKPVCRIPNLAIHLNRGVNDSGLVVNAQTQLPPVFGLDVEGEDPIRALLARALDVAADRISTWDLMLYDLAPAARAGANDELVLSARLDNLASCHAGLEALLATDAEAAPHTRVLALFDHEEIGSTSSRGAQSHLLTDVLERVVRDAARGGPGGLMRAIRHSIAVSADMAHAVHPGHADKHDAEHMPKIGLGPVIKQNANQRYATEADTAAWFAACCERAGVPSQWFVNRSDLACGSTVGPMVAANLSIRTVDVGGAMLSMHSIREMTGAADHDRMIRALAEALRGGPTLVD